MSRHTEGSWFTANMGNHQGLVIDEDTGRNIAVCYDKADAPLIAAAPKLLAACREATAALQIALANLNRGVSSEMIGKLNKMRYDAEAAIDAATEESEEVTG